MTRSGQDGWGGDRMGVEESVVVEVRGLDFAYDGSDRTALSDIHLELFRSERCLLVGPNGAGKTTLLRILAGKHMVPRDKALVMGRPVFADTALADQVTFLSEVVPSAVDLPVSEVIERVRTMALAGRPGSADEMEGRLSTLLDLLGVDPDWRLHRLSRGQRRRVYLLAGLLQPRRLLLLDEVAADLDLLARHRLLDFLRSESETRQTTILYATHIMDGLADWATHLLYLEAGRVQLFRRIEEVEGYVALRSQGEPDPLGRFLLERMELPAAKSRI